MVWLQHAYTLNTRVAVFRSLNWWANNCATDSHYYITEFVTAVWPAIRIHTIRSNDYNAFMCTSAWTRTRAKLKHISQRRVIAKTNQDSLSNGEWSGKQYIRSNTYHQLNERIRPSVSRLCALRRNCSIGQYTNNHVVSRSMCCQQSIISYHHAYIPTLIILCASYVNNRSVPYALASIAYCVCTHIHFIAPNILALIRRSVE